MRVSIPRSVNDYIALLIMMFTISTLFQGIIPFSLNRIIITAILILVFFYDLRNPTKHTLFLLLYLVILAFLNVMLTQETSLALKDLIYFGTTLCLLDYLKEKTALDKLKNSFEKYKKIFKVIFYIVYGITVLSVFSSANYSYAWGESNYFIGLARDTHVMASSTCLLMAFMLFLFFKEKFSYVRLGMFVMLLFIVFQTGARTYIVSATIILYAYIQGNINGTLKKTILLGIAVTAVVIIFLRSGMYQKFIWSSIASNQGTTDSLVSSTGGRSAFWLIDIKEFVQNNPIYQLIGHGFDYVYQVNYEHYHMHIWAHNDIIDLLLSVGLIGTIYYLREWVSFFIMSFAQNKNKRLLVAMCVYIAFPMFFNGLFTVQHYFMSVIIMTITLRGYKNEQY
ncbi:MAG: O-antigen ligase family protein [Anaerostipes sp.]|nr:O-antigen ligase family protein [Anaerostipes sp.]